MALSRWSHSAWYIYDECTEPGEPEAVCVCGFGRYTAEDIFHSFDEINSKAKHEGYGLYDRLELHSYLSLWANSTMNYRQRSLCISLIRLASHLKRYVTDPYGFTAWTSDFSSAMYYLEDVVNYSHSVLFPKSYEEKQVLVRKAVASYMLERILKRGA